MPRLFKLAAQAFDLVFQSVLRLQSGELGHECILARWGSLAGPVILCWRAREGEILALRWTDFDAANKALRVERAIEDTKQFGVRFKGPKKASHKRAITIDDDLVALLLAEREKTLRVIAGVPDSASVDLSLVKLLVKLPEDALVFPKPFTLSEPRRPRNMAKEFVRKARKLGFKKLRFHGLRGSHETMLLDAGVPIHVVARCGHDPATLLRNYAKRTKRADTSAASVIGNISRTILSK
jgi:integrase